MAPNLTSDWLTDKLAAWQTHVVPRLHSVAGANWLDVGSYEGRSALYALEHVLGPRSTVFCVDVFDDNFPGIATWGQYGYATRFDENTLEPRRQGRIVKLCGQSSNVLAALHGITLNPPLRDITVEQFRGTRFHGAYLDADHQEHNVRWDLFYLWPLLLPGAVLVCDDYNCPGQPGAHVAIDSFLSTHGHEATVLHTGFQIILLKK